MATVTVHVCDICEEPSTSTYTIETVGILATLDLCAQHEEPLAGLLQHAETHTVNGSAPAKPRTRKAQRNGVFDRMLVTDIADVK